MAASYDVVVSGIPELLSRALAAPRPDPALPDGVPAAVIVPVLDLPRPALLFTKRSEHVRDHKGEISFPGGVRHAEDPDLLATALRETEEELGIPADALEVLGALPPTHTVVSGYVILPFVAMLRARPDLVVSAAEIAEVIELDLPGLAEVETPVDGFDPGGHQRSWFTYEIDGHVVWGATGRILHSFIEALKKEGWTP